MPCNVNTALDVSMPMRLYWVMDGSGLGCSQPQFWHSMPWGRPPQQFYVGGPSGPYRPSEAVDASFSWLRDREPPQLSELAKKDRSTRQRIHSGGVDHGSRGSRPV